MASFYVLTVRDDAPVLLCEGDSDTEALEIVRSIKSAKDLVATSEQRLFFFVACNKARADYREFASVKVEGAPLYVQFR